MPVPVVPSPTGALAIDEVGSKFEPRKRGSPDFLQPRNQPLIAAFGGGRHGPATHDQCCSSRRAG
jgi:hypothetical protein